MRIRKSSGSNSATPRSTRATSTIASTATKDTGGKPTLSTPEQSKGRTKKKSQSGKLTMARILTSFESVSGDYLLARQVGNSLIWPPLTRHNVALPVRFPMTRSWQVLTSPGEELTITLSVSAKDLTLELSHPSKSKVNSLDTPR